MANEPSKIYGALVQAMTEIGAITKDHKNEFQNYNFRGIDDVYKAVQPTFIKCGIVVVPQVLKSKQEERKTKKGETLIYTILTMRFAFYSAEDDSRVDAITVGEASQSPLIGSVIQTPGNFLFFVSIGYSGKSVHLFKNCSRAIFRVPHTTSF